MTRMGWPTAFAFLVSIAFDFLLFGGTGYAVFWLGYSGWWFLLAILISSGSPNPLTYGKPPKPEEAP